MTPRVVTALAFAGVLCVGYLVGVGVGGRAHADPGVVDRALVERLVRAVEQVARNTERCR